jgi:Tol biopolymer transport system component
MSDPVTRLNAALEGRYRIEREVGEGGMATVYLAADLKHERKVALKVLRPELAAVVGADRFLAEIKTTANLQHPHILPLFDSGEAEGFLFYVMPYVEGESLRERLDREHQLPVQEAVTIVTKVAGALQTAHERRVIHRDIKPANILLSKGEPLVADFGIALAVSAAGGKRLTETGLSLGTPHYMSPEQVTADRELDGRSDVYSLGASLYEMLVGRPPFEAASAQAVVAKILTTDPPRVAAERSTVPAHVDGAVRRALAKLPADRFDTPSRFAEALTRAELMPLPSPAEDGAGGLRVARVEVRRWHAGAVVGLALVAVAAAVLGWLRPPGTPPSGPSRLSIQLPPGQEPIAYFMTSPLAVSPDGRVVAYTAAVNGGVSSRPPEASLLYVRDLDRFESRALQGTGGAYSPFFSPDGRWIGFFARRRLWKVALDGGSPLPIAEVGDVRTVGSWGADGSIVFTDELVGELMRVSAEGGEPETVPFNFESLRPPRLPHALPDGRVLVTVQSEGGDRQSAAVLDPATGDVEVVLDDASDARWVRSGHLVYGQAGAVRAVAFDPARLEVTSSAVTAPDGVMFDRTGMPFLAVSSEGTLVYLPAIDPETGLPFRGGPGSGHLVRVSREGVAARLWEGWPGAGRVRLSPDGRRVTDYVPTSSEEIGNFRVWVFDLERGNGFPLTSERQRTSIYPVWTPDGRGIVFSDNVSGLMSPYRTSADGTGEPEPLTDGGTESYPYAVSADGRLLAYNVRDPDTGFDLWVLPLDGDGEAESFLRTPASESSPAFSPDGRWIAYESDVSGREEIYVRPYPGPGDRVTVSARGGTRPMWAPDGSEIYYRRGGQIWAVPVRGEPDFRAGEPGLLFEGTYGPNYDVAPDGDGFIVVELQGAVMPDRFHIVFNWFDELRAQVGN